MTNHIVIIGNGVAGITAARHIRKLSNHSITVISSETTHFFSRTALMYVYMGHMKFEHTKPYEDSFWKKNKIDLVFDHVESLHSPEQKLKLRSGKTLHYDQLIIASGSRYNKLDVPGMDLSGVQGLYSYSDLLEMEEHTRNIESAVVVGGGLIGVEMAEMLHSRKINVSFLVREEEFWSNVLPLSEARMIGKHIRERHVNLLRSTELQEIVGNGKKVSAVVTNTGEIIPCQFVGVTIGVSPNIEFLKSSELELNRGVLVNEYLETNLPNVFAIGDCAERKYYLPFRKSVEQVWYTGRMMGETVAHTICGRRMRYEPGPWFNSAKFFDIEYQTYGEVDSKLRPNEGDFYWEHSSGTKAMHFTWSKSSKVFHGVNTFGIRLRHECFDKWLREKQTIDFVLHHLAEANFDPEFFAHHEDEIITSFRSKQNLPIL